MKPDQIDRRISELENELLGLRRRKVAELQEVLQKLQADLNGAAPTRRTRGKTAASDTGSKRKYTKTGPRAKKLSDEEIIERLTPVVAAAGPEGISARAAADNAKVIYVRAMNLMGTHFAKSGSGKWTRYTSK